LHGVEVVNRENRVVKLWKPFFKSRVGDPPEIKSGIRAIPITDAAKRVAILFPALLGPNKFIVKDWRRTTLSSGVANATQMASINIVEYRAGVATASRQLFHFPVADCIPLQ
jgi:hypothetical protein